MQLSSAGCWQLLLPFIPGQFGNSISQEERAVNDQCIEPLPSQGSLEIVEYYCLLTQGGDLLSPACTGQKPITLRLIAIAALTSPRLLTDLQAADLQPPHHLHVWVGGYTVGSLKTNDKKSLFRNKTLPGTPFREVESCSQIQDIHHFFSGKTRWKGLNLGFPQVLCCFG